MLGPQNETLDEPRRRAYLRALGVDLWVPRVVARAASESALRPAAAAEAQPVELLEPPVVPPSESALLPDRIPEPPPDRNAESLAARESGPEGSAAALAPAEPSPVAPPPILVLPDPIPGPPGSQDMDWDALAAEVAGCRACPLCETRTQTVFGVGNREADLLVIGEAPGADEDREGEPFVGRAGRLLNRMLAAIGLPRSQVYIANILKCRPPGNRDPRPDEVLHCQGFLQRQLALIQPRVILSVGRISAQTLLGTDTPVGRLRGRWLAYGPDNIPLRVTYHPAYLLRSPDQKAKAWEDLTQVALQLASAPRDRP